MTLRKKTTAIIGVTLLGLIVMLYASASNILLNGFEDAEKQTTTRNVERVLDALSNELEKLDRLTGDWAMWDDSYAFIEDENDAYVESNLLAGTFVGLRLNLLLFINSSGKIVYGRGFDLENEQEIPLAETWRTHLTTDSPLLEHSDPARRVTGIVLLPEGPILVAAHPIVTSEGHGPIRGTLITGRSLDSAEIARLAALTHVPLTVRRFDDPQLPGDFEFVRPVLSEESAISVRPLSTDSIAGYALLKDIYGRPALIVRAELPRAIYRQGQTSVKYLLGSLLAIGLVFGTMTRLLLEKSVLSRLAHLSADVSSIGASGDASRRVHATGRDELARLADEINRMLAALEHSQWEHRESEERYRHLVELAPEGIAVLRDGVLVFVNSAGVKLVGATSAAELMRKPLLAFLPPERHATVEEQVRRLIAEGGEIARIEEKLIRIDGTAIEVEVTASPLTYRGRPAMQVIVRDISERKWAEEALRKSEAENRALLNAMPDLMFRVSRRGTILAYKAEHDEDLVAPPGQFLGRELTQVLPKEVAQQAMEAVGGALDTGTIQTYEYQLMLAGTVKHFEARVVVTGTEEVLVIVRNITARKRAEALEHDRNRALEMVAKGEPLKAILDQLVQMIERQRPGVCCSIALLDHGRLYHRAGSGMPLKLIRAVDDHPIGPNAGPWGIAAYRGETVIVSDVAADPLCENYRPLALAHAIRSCWSVPIISGLGQVFGVFSMYGREPRLPDSDEVILLAMAARMAAIAIEHRQLTDQLAYQAQHDALTGLPNRVLFEDRLRQAIAHAERQEQLLALLFIDLDRFKLINDTLGHAVGDALLQQVARRLESRVRRSDTIARMGGDEFTVVVTDLKELQSAARVAEKLLDALRLPFDVEGHELFVTGSVGISLYPSDGEDVTELLRKADSAMYCAKEQGKNEYQFYSTDVDTATLERLRLERELYQALERGELRLYYQPQFDLKSGRLVGAEALLRWKHITFGMVAPSTFIPMAEESGLIISIGTWALHEACRQNKAWQRAGHPALKVAVNVSALQFARTNFVDTTAEALAHSGLAPYLLELELTESMLMYDASGTASKLQRLQTLGVHVSIDDFGTGYSSLAYLHRLPIDTLKIDRSFIRNIGMSPEHATGRGAIVKAITTLAHNLQMRVVAEGVETADQLVFLRQIGCDGIQGFLISEALPAEQFERVFLRTRTMLGANPELGLRAETAGPEISPAAGTTPAEPWSSNV